MIESYDNESELRFLKQQRINSINQINSRIVKLLRYDMVFSNYFENYHPTFKDFFLLFSDIVRISTETGWIECILSYITDVIMELNHICLENNPYVEHDREFYQNIEETYTELEKIFHEMSLEIHFCAETIEEIDEIITYVETVENVCSWMKNFYRTLIFVIDHPIDNISEYEVCKNEYVFPERLFLQIFFTAFFPQYFRNAIEN
jgi:hypothetical protein